MLVEGPCTESEHLLEARHAGMAPGVDGRVLINDGIAPAGTMVEVEVTEAFADDLVGRIVGPIGVPGILPAATVTAG
jgi:ribosomal protein S12 methylthiotransferase